MKAIRWGWVVGMLLLCRLGGAGPAVGQGLDEPLLREVYGAESGLFRASMRVVDVTAYGLFAGVPAALFASAYVFDAPDLRPVAYRVGLAEAVALGGAVVLKQVYGRPRPYTVVEGITSRAVGLDRYLLEHDTLSFPSAHAALAFAMATSLSLSYPTWRVAVPALLWAGAVAVSRVWLGVHYPTDVLAGLLVGTAAGVGVHLLRDRVTPAWLHHPGGGGVQVRLAFSL